MDNVFLLKKGGETENVETIIVRLTHEVDIELIKTAINKIASKRDITEKDVLGYIDTQFNGISDVDKMSNLNTFYY